MISFLCEYYLLRKGKSIEKIHDTSLLNEILQLIKKMQDREVDLQKIRPLQKGIKENVLDLLVNKIITRLRAHL